MKDHPPPATVVSPPTLATLRRYGLTLPEWRAVLKAQGGVCAICQRVPRSGRLAVDHQHVRGWKRMAPAARRRYVRGLCCFLCNGKCVSKWMTTERAKRVHEYFLAHDRRLARAGLYY